MIPKQFFIPELEGAQQKGEDLYQSIQKFVARWGPIEKRRIHSMMFWDRVNKKKPVKAAVGRPDPCEGGLVFAIFELGESYPYLICTTSRGVRRGDPLVISRVDVTEVEYFEA
jgi:hypothetical protein